MVVARHQCMYLVQLHASQFLQVGDPQWLGGLSRASQKLHNLNKLLAHRPWLITKEHMEDYSWEDHGYSLMNRLYPDMGQLLDEKFQTVYNLTYKTMAMHS
ncbi:Sestrin-1 [Acipenser ruthenus]|uniref:Sestrin-1 n=1 Tax=Acipenser ruthenus TaxID=7906 RepID=A0A444V2E4_ACIRT|nr:Sestrin-1 [Acipenser ruthenus]